jgi:hypothetical protein
LPGNPQFAPVPDNIDLPGTFVLYGVAPRSRPTHRPSPA